MPESKKHFTASCGLQTVGSLMMFIEIYLEPQDNSICRFLSPKSSIVNQQSIRAVCLMGIGLLIREHLAVGIQQLG
jgi:hypothetical protein